MTINNNISGNSSNKTNSDNQFLPLVKKEETCIQLQTPQSIYPQYLPQKDCKLSLNDTTGRKRGFDEIDSDLLATATTPLPHSLSANQRPISVEDEKKLKKQRRFVL